MSKNTYVRRLEHILSGYHYKDAIRFYTKNFDMSEEFSKENNDVTIRATVSSLFFTAWNIEYMGISLTFLLIDFHGYMTESEVDSEEVLSRILRLNVPNSDCLEDLFEGRDYQILVDHNPNKAIGVLMNNDERLNEEEFDVLIRRFAYVSRGQRQRKLPTELLMFNPKEVFVPISKEEVYFEFIESKGVFTRLDEELLT